MFEAVFQTEGILQSKRWNSDARSNPLDQTIENLVRTNNQDNDYHQIISNLRMGEVEEVIGTLGHPYTPFEGKSLANTLIKFKEW